MLTTPAAMPSMLNKAFLEHIVQPHLNPPAICIYGEANSRICSNSMHMVPAPAISEATD